ncbi:hypothetical protein B0H12DRAFT_1069864 [Mycena haematopus]|nr:hypothetical protein B0H12DRAFT_1079170 [Mycena haematopus]KAJ7259964.1 hypothetical protein B0H12DRAFT_1069864 [Mycena haematopus]
MTSAYIQLYNDLTTHFNPAPIRRVDTLFKQIQPWLDNSELLQLALSSYTTDAIFGLALKDPLIWQAAATLWLSTTPKPTQKDGSQTFVGMQGHPVRRNNLMKMPNELHILYMTELDVQSLLALATAYPDLKQLCDYAWSSFIRQYFSKLGLVWDHFRYALDATGTILTGPFAHHLLFTAGHRAELDECCAMDLYVYGKDNFSSIIKYFTVIAPYVLYRSETVRTPSVRKTVKLKRRGESVTGLDIAVHLCTARPQAVVLRQPWTSNFSWFSGREIFVAYPALTFRSLAMLSHHSNDLRDSYAIAELKTVKKVSTQRGFEFVSYHEDGPEQCGISPACPGMIRSSMDEHCFRVTYHSGQLVVGQPDFCPRTEVSWSLGSKDCKPRGNGIPFFANAFEVNPNKREDGIYMARMEAILF